MKKLVIVLAFVAALLIFVIVLCIVHTNETKRKLQEGLECFKTMISMSLHQESIVQNQTIVVADQSWVLVGWKAPTGLRLARLEAPPSDGEVYVLFWSIKDGYKPKDFHLKKIQIFLNREDGRDVVLECGIEATEAD